MGISKSFNGLRVLDSVNLSLSSPGLVAIVGPNGSGKTTLLNVLSGFVRADEGRWFLGEWEATGKPHFAIARHGLIRSFQDLRIPLGVPIIESVVLALSPHKSEKFWTTLVRGRQRSEAKRYEEAREILRVVELEGQATMDAIELSYGQKKLLSLMCCIASGSRFILLDEPFAGVHPSLIAMLMRILRMVVDEGKLVVFVEHDLEAVSALASSVVAMDSGKILGIDQPLRLFSRQDFLSSFVKS